MRKWLFMMAMVAALAVPLFQGASAQGSGTFGTVRFGATGASCADFGTLAQVPAGATRLTAGGLTVVIGYLQKTNINKDPIIAAYDGAGNLAWCKDNYEQSPVDGEAYGLYWDGATMYGIFRIDGGIGGGFVQTFNVNGWLNSLAGAGGGSFTIVARLNPANGDSLGATYIHSRLSSTGAPNSFMADQFTFNGSSVIVTGNSASFPINIDRSIMGCEQGSPYRYTVELTADLSAAIGAAAERCISSSPPPSSGVQPPTDPVNPVQPVDPLQPVQPPAPPPPAVIMDGRLNATALAGPVAIYCHNGGGVIVYGVNFATAEGYLLFSATLDEINAAFDQVAATGVYATIQQAANGTALYALTSDELQVNAFNAEGNLYEFIFPRHRCG